MLVISFFSPLVFSPVILQVSHYLTISAGHFFVFIIFYNCYSRHFFPSFPLRLIGPLLRERVFRKG
jgi:hypothetical protein